VHGRERGGRTGFIRLPRVATAVRSSARVAYGRPAREASACTAAACAAADAGARLTRHLCTTADTTLRAPSCVHAREYVPAARSMHACIRGHGARSAWPATTASRPRQRAAGPPGGAVTTGGCAWRRPPCHTLAPGPTAGKSAHTESGGPAHVSSHAGQGLLLWPATHAAAKRVGGEDRVGVGGEITDRG
jgi:hypothetical protein